MLAHCTFGDEHMYTRSGVIVDVTLDLVDCLAQEMPKNRTETSAHTYHYLGAFLRSCFQRPAQGDSLLSTQVAP